MPENTAHQQNQQKESAKSETRQDNERPPREQFDRNRFYTLDADNPLICRGID